MITTQCDQKGRIQLKQAVREKYGEKFVIVEAPDKILLLPVPRDPVRDLEELGRPLRGISMKALKKRIRARAEEEALRALR